MKTRRRHLSRRSFLGGLGAAGALGAAASLSPRSLIGRARAQSPAPADGHRFLIVLAAGGGASIVDGPLAIPRSKSANPTVVNTFGAQRLVSVPGAVFSAVDMRRGELGQIPSAFTANQSDFVRAHHDDMLVSTWTRTSVNHAIGQRRSVTGNEAWLGRTLQECVAWQYGADFPIPNVHLSTGAGFTERGTDGSLPNYCYGEAVTDPTLWPLALDGAKGLARPPSRSLLAAARALRNERLDPQSRFARVFADSPRLAHWQHTRGAQQAAIEEAGLIDKLIFTADSEERPLSRFGLAAAADAERVREAFPLNGRDPMESQAALAFLLLKHRVSCTVTLGPSDSFVFVGERDGGLSDDSVTNPPLAFDYSHQAHRSVQSLMWHRLYRVADGLIRLLKEEPYGDDGESMWDRTMIYVATDFGRDKHRPEGASEWGTGHDLNNGVLMVSPMLAGNKILGGVDPDTGKTYGCDMETGVPVRGRHNTEREVFAGILRTMKVDVSGAGLPDVRAMRREA